MSDIVKNIKEANDKIISLQSELAEEKTKSADYQKTIEANLTAKLDSDELIKTLKADHAKALTDKDATHVSAMDVLKKDHEKAITDINSTHAEAIKKADTKIEDTKKSVMNEVSNKIAAIGIPIDEQSKESTSPKSRFTFKEASAIQPTKANNAVKQMSESGNISFKTTEVKK